ncbi:MAG: GPW/gp25 family protein [Myxococcales bacterium]
MEFAQFHSFERQSTTGISAGLRQILKPGYLHRRADVGVVVTGPWRPADLWSGGLERLVWSVGIDAGGGRAAEEGDYEAYVRQLIRQVLLVAPGERINRPDFGAGVRRMVFQPTSPEIAAMAQTIVYQALSRWLSTVIKVEAVQVTSAESTLLIDVRYLIVQRGETRVLREEVAF